MMLLSTAQRINDKLDPRFRWPRVMRVVERYVGSRSLALRYLVRAAGGEPLSLEIVHEAFYRRHKRDVL